MAVPHKYHLGDITVLQESILVKGLRQHRNSRFTMSFEVRAAVKLPCGRYVEASFSVDHQARLVKD